MILAVIPWMSILWMVLTSFKTELDAVAGAPVLIRRATPISVWNCLTFLQTRPDELKCN
jgi:hypothetical protein